MSTCPNCMRMERERDLARGELGRVRWRADKDLAYLRGVIADMREELEQRREYMRRGMSRGSPGDRS